jgi:glycosyltransferase involved in cell wall biosynthesis
VPRLRLRRRADFILAALDTSTALFICYLAYHLRFEGEPRLPLAYVHRYEAATALCAAVWLVAAQSNGLYRRGALRQGTSNLEMCFGAASITGGALLVGDYVLASGKLSRAWIALVVLGLTVGGLGSRALVRRSRRALVPLGLALERYAVIGDGVQIQRLENDLTRARGAPFRLVARLSPDIPPDELLRQVRQMRLDGLVLPPGSVELGARLASGLSGSGVDVLVAPQFGQLELRVASIAMLHGVPLLRVAGMAPRRRGVRTRARDRTRRGVAILGTRGVPANYGGFETFAERLALRLVEDRVETTVYCRSHYATAASPWNGVRLVSLPTIRTKHLDTVVHTLISAVHLVLTRGPRDVVLCNAANAPVLLLLRAGRRRVVLNVDGLEWRRTKWGVLGRSWYRLGEWLSVRFASVLVTDASEVQTYYRVRHDTDSVMIPYGADLLTRGEPRVPAEVGAEPERYVLYVSRWERENNPLLVASAHARAQVDLDLVMLGTATYDQALDEEVRSAASPRARFPGPLYGDGYRGLQANAACYVHATEVGGTHPALIEALGAGNLCLVLDTPENREVVGDAGRYFADEACLVELLQWAAAMPPRELEQWREQARRRAKERFSWDAVGRAYLSLLRGDG